MRGFRRFMLAGAGLLVLVLASVLLLLSPAEASAAKGPPAVYCTDCHDGFVPYDYKIDAPLEVPVDAPFLFNLTVRNDRDHTVKGLTAVITLSPGMMVLGTSQEDQTFTETGSVRMLQTQSFGLTIAQGAESASVVLDGQEQLFNDIDLVVSGPEGGSWSSSGSGVDESVTLGPAEIGEGGYGTYNVEVVHRRGVRPTGFTLTMGVEYGQSGSAQLSGPDLGPGQEHIFSWELIGSEKGSSDVTVDMSGTAYYEHQDSNREEEEEFKRTASAEVVVGTQFVYGSRGGFSSSIDKDAVFAYARYLGVLAAALLLASVLFRVVRRLRTGFPRMHCRLAYAMLAVFALHWVLLWLGPYGTVLGGIGTGGLMLVPMLLLGVTGKWPRALGGRVAWLTNKRLHRGLSIALALLLILHAVLNGTELAFVRGILGL